MFGVGLGYGFMPHPSLPRFNPFMHIPSFLYLRRTHAGRPRLRSMNLRSRDVIPGGVTSGARSFPPPRKKSWAFIGLDLFILFSVFLDILPLVPTIVHLQLLKIGVPLTLWVTTRDGMTSSIPTIRRAVGCRHDFIRVLNPGLFSCPVNHPCQNPALIFLRPSLGLRET